MSETLWINYRLSERETEEVRKEVVALVKEIDEVEAEKKDVVADYNDKIKSLRGTLRERNDIAASGEMKRLAYVEKSVVFGEDVVRYFAIEPVGDTVAVGEVVFERPIRPEERQTTAFYDGDE